MWYERAAAAGAWLLDAIAPRCCAGCGRPVVEELCARCLALVARLPMPSPQDTPYGRCSGPFYFEGLVRRLVHQGKYRGRRRALAVLAALGAERLYPLFAAGSAPELVVAVPLGRRRRRQRGYNQAAVVADQVAALVPSVPRRDALRRVRETRPQVGQDRTQRARNLVDAFAWSDARLRGTVWLVDDVATTGATLNAAAAALQRAGAVRIEAVALAIAPGPQPRE